MALGRNQLKQKFLNSTTIDVATYDELIDSTINIEDDGIKIDDEKGLILKARGQEANMISLYRDQGNAQPEWAIALQADNQKGFNITDGTGKSHLFIHQQGNIGVGETRPQHKLQINGAIGMKGRVGTYKVAHVPADGKWQVALKEVDLCQAFEIFAHIQFEREMPFALTRSVVMLSGGQKGTRIRTKRASIGRGEFWEYFRKKIQFRWKLLKP